MTIEGQREIETPNKNRSNITIVQGLRTTSDHTQLLQVRTQESIQGFGFGSKGIENNKIRTQEEFTDLKDPPQLKTNLLAEERKLGSRNESSITPTKDEQNMTQFSVGAALSQNDPNLIEAVDQNVENYLQMHELQG